MKVWMKRLLPLVCAVVLQSTLMGRAQADINPRAKEDLNAFVKKVEEGDSLFNQKKYAEAAAALAAAHDLYQRADRRDDSASGSWFTIKPGAFPALRYYGYLTGPRGSLKGETGDTIEDRYASFHGAANDMWRDASILGDVEKVPLVGALKDFPIEKLTEEQLLYIVKRLYDEVRGVTLPVPDHEWRNVLLPARRALLITEHALQKYPEWRTNTINWVGQPTGDQVLADIKKILAEAEPEYQNLVAEFNKAEPAGFAEAMREEVTKLNKVIANVKRNGWLDWGLARDLFITKDHLSDVRKWFVHLYKKDGKTMPSDKLTPIENKIAELKSTIDKNASLWRFPTNKPHNAAIEARVKSDIKGRFPGVTIYKTALDGTDWTIQKNDIGLPRYRERDVLALVKIPGQKWPWLISGSFHQTYSGGGTYNSGGTFELSANYAYARMQAAK